MIRAAKVACLPSPESGSIRFSPKRILPKSVERGFHEISAPASRSRDDYIVDLHRAQNRQHHDKHKYRGHERHCNVFKRIPVIRAVYSRRLVKGPRNILQSRQKNYESPAETFPAMNYGHGGQGGLRIGKPVFRQLRKPYFNQPDIQ
jgi:hypothetical protein